MHDKLLSQLTSSQKQAVLNFEGPLLVIAGPGSGKTRVITYRIAAIINSGVRPYNVCAITFTNKAAEEMRQRAAVLGASAGARISTFHSLCVRILREYAVKAGIKSNFSIYDGADQAGCIKQAVKDCDLDVGNFSPARMLDAISTLKNKLIDAESFKTEAEDFVSKSLAKIYTRYQNILGEHNALDFDDLLMKTAVLLRKCPDVREELGNRFKYLLVDEYQDTNHAQYQIARDIASSHGNICVTGDPDQSIYRWRGADIRNILAFEKDWPNAVIIKLEENFRSTANILAAADRLISFNRNRKEKKLVPVKPSGKDVVVTGFEDEQDEALGVARQIMELADANVPLRNIAVFYRVNSMSRALEEAFIQTKVPYQIIRGVEFYNRREIRDMLAYLKILTNPDDETALLRIINTPTRGIGKTTIDRVMAYASQQGISFFEALRQAGQIVLLSKAAQAQIAVFVAMIERFKNDVGDKIAKLTERVFIESGLQQSLKDGAANGETALENINELINSAARYDIDAEQPSLLDYLQQISLFSDTDVYDASKDRVSLMTLHTAKGLEFENVFIIGVEDGLLPHERSNTDDKDEMEEERRLFFVGITRTKSGLHISYSRYRTIRGQLLRTIPSPFLYELGVIPAEHTSEYQPAVAGSSDNGNSEIPPFVAGQLVRHKTFGTGTVKEFIDMGENSVVVVRFNTGQTKTLMIKFAHLSEI